MNSTATTTATATTILDAAQQLAQTRGYNAFSYRDLAERVGIRTASIHYHLPTKGDLGVALVARYGAFVADALAALDRRDAGTLAFPGAPDATATTLFSALEGAMLVARTAGDVGRYRSAGGWLLAMLTATVAAPVASPGPTPAESPA